MKDIPFFTTENGAAGLTLREVPYSQNAYVTVHSAQDLEALLGECLDFCKAVGAARVYACNHQALEQYPVYTQALEMAVPRADLPPTDARAIPVTEDTMKEFAEIFRQKMKDVPAAKHLTLQQEKEMVTAGRGFFVRRGESLLGICIAGEGKIDAVASLRKGAGRDVVLAACAALDTDTVRLEVASANEKAVRLYRSLGFIQTEVKNIWYEIS